MVQYKLKIWALHFFNQVATVREDSLINELEVGLLHNMASAIPSGLSAFAACY